MSWGRGVGADKVIQGQIQRQKGRSRKLSNGISFEQEALQACSLHQSIGLDVRFCVHVCFQKPAANIHNNVSIRAKVAKFKRYEWASH